MNRFVVKLLRALDNITLRHATQLITLSGDMKSYLKAVSKTQAPIHMIDNPAFEVDSEFLRLPKTKDIIFCGNAGRVQQIPVLLNAIGMYLDQGGTLNFSFAGGGGATPMT